MTAFIERLCAAVAATDGGDGAMRALIGRAIADTVAVAAAGWDEPVTQAAITAYAGTGPRSWAGTTMESAEAAVMINAIAAHALDFDDVYLDSATHPSAVIIPAVLALDAVPAPGALISAIAAGLIAARAVAGYVGRSHYGRGFHGTSTIGAFSAAAAAGRLAGLNELRQRHAFGLAASLSGGLQANFSTMAKPCHAGFAASAGLRAVRLAAAGVTAADDIFRPGGYADLYGGGGETLTDSMFELRADEVAVKLFPCCFAASRLVGIALDARRSLGPIFGADDVRLRMAVPAGSLHVLRYPSPTDGLQAKFSAPFTVCAALLDGPLLIPHFDDAQVHRADILACMARLEIVEDQGQQSQGDIAFGTVVLDVIQPGGTARFTRGAIPGSAADPASPEAVRTKAQGCLDAFAARFGTGFPIAAKLGGMDEVAHWLTGSDGCVS